VSLICWTLVSVLCIQSQEVYRFGIEVPAVYVDVFVTRDGKSVTGLTAGDFEVFDSGVQQEVRLVDLETVPLSAMMVLDASGSVRGDKLTHLRAGAHAFISGLRNVDEAGILAFSQHSQVLRSPTRDSAALHAAVDQLASGGATALYDALYSGLRLIEGRPGRPLIVLFTDGMDNSSWLSSSEVQEVILASEAVVYAVGVASAAGVRRSEMHPTSVEYWTRIRYRREPERFLKDLTSATGGELRYAESSAGLEDLYVRILQEMGSRYLLTYHPRGVPEEGWHPLQVKLKEKQADEVRARSGYMVGPR
jgi:VWFA-related protein